MKFSQTGYGVEEFGTQEVKWFPKSEMKAAYAYEAAQQDKYWAARRVGKIRVEYAEVMNKKEWSGNGRLAGQDVAPARVGRKGSAKN